MNKASEVGDGGMSKKELSTSSWKMKGSSSAARAFDQLYKFWKEAKVVHE